MDLIEESVVEATDPSLKVPTAIFATFFGHPNLLHARINLMRRC
jgi:hypothetical protein